MPAALHSRLRGTCSKSRVSSFWTAGYTGSPKALFICTQVPTWTRSPSGGRQEHRRTKGELVKVPELRSLPMGSQSSVCQLQGPLGSGSLSPPPAPVLSGPAGLLLLHLHPPPAPCLTLQAQCPAKLLLRNTRAQLRACSGEARRRARRALRCYVSCPSVCVTVHIQPGIRPGPPDLAGGRGNVPSMPRRRRRSRCHRGRPRA